MEVTRSWKTLVALMLLFAASGANCRQFARVYTEPRTLPESATLEQIVEKVNGNTAKIISAESTRATLKAEGIPMVLGANIALMPQQRRLHLQGSLMGPRIDLGSNEEQFWIWIKDNDPPAVFVCRHDQFAQSNARQLIPIEPERLIEAIGLPHIDPNLVMGSPHIVGANRIEIGSRLPSELGDMKKITIVDGWNGLVLEQHIYDSLGMEVASSFTSNYKHDPVTGAAMPRSIEIRWPTAKMSFKLDVNDWSINQISPDNTALWAVPQPKDYPIVDLADPNIRFSDPNAPATAPPVAHQPVPRGMMPQQPVGSMPVLPQGGGMQQPVPSMQGMPQGEMPPLPPNAVHPAANPLR